SFMARVTRNSSTTWRIKLKRSRPPLPRSTACKGSDSAKAREQGGHRGHAARCRSLDMKAPARADAVDAPTRAAARRYLAPSTLPNFSELKAAFSEAVVPTIERHIKNRLMSVKRGAATIVFLDGPFLLIDLSTRLTAGIRNEDALCELLNALLMEEPVSYESQHLLLNVETTLIEWTDMDRQL